MQQIERYGVIALVFLLVTIVAVSFWGDNKSPGFWSRLTGRGDAKKTAVADAPTTSSMLPPPVAAERALQNPLPLSSTSASAPTFEQPAVDPLAAATPQNQTSAPASLSLAPTTATIEPAIHDEPLGVATQAEHAAPIATHVAQKPAASVATSTYVVQKGDSLARIARAKLGNEQRWTEIQALNSGLDPKSLRVGMKLKLPTDAKSEPASPKSKERASAPAKSQSKSGGTYVVKGGDSLRKIAERVLGDGDRWKEIAALNPGLDPKRLAVGASVKLPAGESRALVAAAVPTTHTETEKPRVR